MDKLERYIRENAALLDSHEPDRERIWEQLEQQLDQREMLLGRPIWSSNYFRVAAGLLVVLGCAIVFALIGRPSPSGGIQPGPIERELGDIDRYYQGLIERQLQLIQKDRELPANYKIEFLNVLETLEEEYAVLRYELDRDLDNTVVLRAIVMNYKKRIELLERLLERTEQSDKYQEKNEMYVL